MIIAAELLYQLLTLLPAFTIYNPLLPNLELSLLPSTEPERLVYKRAGLDLNNYILRLCTRYRRADVPYDR